MPAAAPTPTPADFIKKWNIRFADNEFQNINEATFRAFAADIAATFGVQLVNVPAYQLGATYQDGYLVRFTPDGGKESFFYSLVAGILPAPTTDPADKNWRLVPGPVATTVLSQELTLAQAQAIEGLVVMPGRTYIIDFGPDSSGNAQLVTLLGTAVSLFAIRGQLTVAGVRSNVRVNVASGVFGQEAFGLLDTPNLWREVNDFSKGIKLPLGGFIDEYNGAYLRQVNVGQKQFMFGSYFSMARDGILRWKDSEFIGQDGDGDVGLGRMGPGVLEVNTGTAGQAATLNVLDVVAKAAPSAYNTLAKIAAGLARLVGLVPAGATQLVDTNDTRLQDLARGFIDFQNEVELYQEDIANNANSVVFATLPFQTGRSFRISSHLNTPVDVVIKLPNPGYVNRYVQAFRIGPGVTQIKTLTILNSDNQQVSKLTLGQSVVVRGEYGGWSVLLSSGVAGTAVLVSGRFRGPWAKNTAYLANDTVLQGGLQYYALADFTSGAAFAASNWAAMPGGGGGGAVTPIPQDYYGPGSPPWPLATLDDISQWNTSRRAYIPASILAQNLLPPLTDGAWEVAQEQVSATLTVLPDGAVSIQPNGSGGNGFGLRFQCNNNSFRDKIKTNTNYNLWIVARITSPGATLDVQTEARGDGYRSLATGLAPVALQQYYTLQLFNMTTANYNPANNDNMLPSFFLGQSYPNTTVIKHVLLLPA